MLTVLLTAVAAGPLGAQSRQGAAPPAEKAEPRRPATEIAISPGEAASIAAARTGGRVLDVKFQGGARPRYRVRVLLRGERVRTVTVDAVTGEFRG